MDNGFTRWVVVHHSILISEEASGIKIFNSREEALQEIQKIMDSKHSETLTYGLDCEFIIGELILENENPCIEAFGSC